MEWVLGKQPVNIDTHLFIDDNDLIRKNVALSVMINIFNQEKEEIQAKFIQDIYLLIKFNNKNIEKLMFNKEFLCWLCDVLAIRYNEIIQKANENGYKAAIWDMGLKIFVIIITYLAQNCESEEDFFNKIDFLLKYLQIKQSPQNNYGLIRCLWRSMLVNLTYFSKIYNFN